MERALANAFEGRVSKLFDAAMTNVGDGQTLESAVEKLMVQINRAADAHDAALAGLK